MSPANAGTREDAGRVPGRLVSLNVRGGEHLRPALGGVCEPCLSPSSRSLPESLDSAVHLLMSKFCFSPFSRVVLNVWISY